MKKWSDIRKLIPSSKYFQGAGASRDVRLFLIDVEEAALRVTGAVTDSAMRSVLLNTTIGDARDFLLNLDHTDSYENWIDSLIDQYSIHMEWEIWLFQHLRSANSLGQLATRMRILRHVTTSVRFGDLALSIRRIKKFPDHEWTKWESVGQNMLLHDAFEALQKKGCLQKARMPASGKSTTAPVSAGTKPRPSNPNRNRNRGSGKGKTAAQPSYVKQVENSEVRVANPSLAPSQLSGTEFAKVIEALGDDDYYDEVTLTIQNPALQSKVKTCIPISVGKAKSVACFGSGTYTTVVGMPLLRRLGLHKSVQLESGLNNASTATGTPISYIGTLTAKVSFPLDVQSTLRFLVASDEIGFIIGEDSMVILGACLKYVNGPQLFFEDKATGTVVGPIKGAPDRR